jgi:hypothetical protein
VPGPRTREAEISDFETFVVKVIILLLVLFSVGALVRFLQWAF